MPRPAPATWCPSRHLVPLPPCRPPRAESVGPGLLSRPSRSRGASPLALTGRGLAVMPYHVAAGSMAYPPRRGHVRRLSPQAWPCTPIISPGVAMYELLAGFMKRPYSTGPTAGKPAYWLAPQLSSRASSDGPAGLRVPPRTQEGCSTHSQVPTVEWWRLRHRTPPLECRPLQQPGPIGTRSYAAQARIARTALSSQ